MAGKYTLIWRFRVRPDCLADYLACYGPDGDWVRLFRRSPGFCETLLLKDLTVPDWYLTIDRWRSEAAYGEFRREFALEYRQLDRQCEGLTLAEEFLGAFCEENRGAELPETC
ncbi:MAG TPA: hypothetical protein DDY32_15790 [Desulfobulbaceae bacterium]|nr:hypothetical protein [Desulfobulbaceae bacterium]